MASVSPFGASRVWLNCTAGRYVLWFVSLTVNAWPDLPARIATPIQLPAALFARNASEEEEVIPASLLVCCTSLIPGGGTVTLKFTPLLAIPATETTTFPLVAPLGTAATMLVWLQFGTVAVTPLNVTVLEPWDGPKFVPVIITEVPTGPDVWLKLEIFIGVTAKFTPLLAAPPVR